MEELGIPELTSKQIEELCSVAEEAARKHVLSKISSKKIETLNICAEAEGTRPVCLNVDVEIVLSRTMRDYDVKKLVDDTVRQAFTSAEKYLRKLKCHSKT